MKILDYYTIFKQKSLNYLLVLFGLALFSSCSQSEGLKIDYSFEAAINAGQNIDNFDQINFQPNDNLDLGFHKGNVWVKLQIINDEKFESYVVMTNDLINRNYRFYKLDTLSNSIFPLVNVIDVTKHDHRTFNYPKPNFKIDLNPNEKATFFMTTVSDGRILQATPQLLSLANFNSSMSKNIIFNIVFFAAIGMLLLINIFHWSILKNKIYYFYGFYILSSCLFYLHVEGQLYGLGISHYTIDHFMFITIRLWIFSAVLFTSKFLELNITNPNFNKFVKWLLILILGVSTLYQFIFYSSSISKLHLIENLFGFVWVIIALSMIILSFKKRKLQAKYYLLAFSFLLFFIVLGLIDSHTTLLPGDPFSYFKIGTIIEFIGFTYFIALIIKRNLTKAAVLENELNLNKKELQDISKQLESTLKLPKAIIEKTDILNIFKLLESTLSKEEEWPEFKTKFEELSPKFLPNLKEAHPNLSKSEIRLLTLIQIGFTQKEIASVLNIVPDSVKKAKQRVRKKLELPSTTNLATYLSQYS
jgi:DNA-binding CsgD family transcriptional regulator